MRGSWVLVAAVALLLAACGERPEGDAVEAELLVSEATLPETDEFAHADIVSEEGDLDAVWQRFGLPADPPTVDLDETVLLFAGFGESSACPATFEGLYVDDGSAVVSLLTGQDGTECTDDFNPRTFVVGVDRDALPEGGFVLDLARDHDRSRGSYVLSATPTGVPPEGPDVFRALATDGVPELHVVAEPEAGPAGDVVELVLDNRGEHGVRLSGPLRILDRWMDQRWVPVDDHPEHGPHPSIEVNDAARVPAGEREAMGAVDTEGLEPGWYAVRVSVSFDGSGGRVDLRTHFEVRP